MSPSPISEIACTPMLALDGGVGGFSPSRSSTDHVFETVITWSLRLDHVRAPDNLTAWLHVARSSTDDARDVLHVRSLVVGEPPRVLQHGPLAWPSGARNRRGT